jgi:hypothetical protein
VGSTGEDQDIISGERLVTFPNEVNKNEIYPVDFAVDPLDASGYKAGNE